MRGRKRTVPALAEAAGEAAVEAAAAVRVAAPEAGEAAKAAEAWQAHASEVIAPGTDGTLMAARKRVTPMSEPVDDEADWVTPLG